MPKSDLVFLQQLLTSGIDLMTQMPLTADVLRRLVPAFSLSMIRVDQRCAPAQHYSEHFDEFSHQLFASSGHEFSARSDDPAAFANLLANPRAIGSLIDTSDSYLAGATYQHLFQRNGIHHVLDVAIRHPGGPLGILGIFREAKAPSFSVSDVARMTEVYPYLVHAFLAEGMPADHDEVESALIIASRAGVIEWASPSARRWLEDAAFGFERSHLVEKHCLPEACREVCSLLDRLQNGGSLSGEANVPTLSVPIPGGRLRLRAYGLAPQADQHGSQVGIQLSLEMHRGLRVLHALSRAQLTPQQRRIAFGYFQGLRPQHISQALGISPSSFKTYRKDLYSRLQVTSEAELLALLREQASAVTFDLLRHGPRQRA